MRHGNRQRGQATVEALVSMLALVPLLILIPYLGKYLDVKSKSVDAARYQAWERTLWSDPGASWGAGENSKSDAELAQETRVRFYGNPGTGIVTDDTTTTQNPLWKRHDGQLLVQDPGNGAPPASEGGAPVSRGVTVDLLSSGFSASGFVDLGLDLNQDGYVDARGRLAATPLPDFDRRGAAVDIATTFDTDANLTFNQVGSILTDPWVPGDEQNFVDRVDGLVVDEILALGVLPGTLTFGSSLFFEEGRKGRNPKLESDTVVIPNQYIDVF